MALWCSLSRCRLTEFKSKVDRLLIHTCWVFHLCRVGIVLWQAVSSRCVLSWPGSHACHNALPRMQNKKWRSFRFRSACAPLSSSCGRVTWPEAACLPPAGVPPYPSSPYLSVFRFIKHIFSISGILSWADWHKMPLTNNLQNVMSANWGKYFMCIIDVCMPLLIKGRYTIHLFKCNLNDKSHTYKYIILTVQ